MKNKILFFSTTLLLICCGLSGCVNTPSNASLQGDLDPTLVGTWLFSEPGRSFTWTIRADGTYSYNEQPGAWATENGAILLLYDNTQTIIRMDYSLLNNGMVLSTTDEYNHTMEYTKQ